MYQCPNCAKNLKSRSGLRRHVKGQHPIDEPALEPTLEAVGPEPVVTEHQDAGDDEKVLKAALKALGIKRENVVDFKVYPHKVVIIEAPKNWKKTWYREA